MASTPWAASRCHPPGALHPVPAGRRPHPADHIRPSRHRQHRLPGQSRLCMPDHSARDRCPVRQARQRTGFGRLDAGQRDPRAVAVDGGMTSRSALRRRPKRRCGFGPLRDLRQGSDLLVTRVWGTALAGAIYNAWAMLGFERGALGLPTSGEIGEPQWIVQNFQHGTLNVDREKAPSRGSSTGFRSNCRRPARGPPVQLERFSPARNRV